MNETPLSKPKRARHPLWLFSPAIEVLIVTAIVTGVGRFSPHHEAYDGVAILLLNLFFALLLCIGLGFWWASAYAFSEAKKLGLGLLMAIGLIIVNTAIAYAGCAVFGSL